MFQSVQRLCVPNGHDKWYVSLPVDNSSYLVQYVFTPMQMWTCFLLGVLSIIPSLLTFYLLQLEASSFVGDHKEMACHVVSPVPDGWSVLLLLAQV